MNTENILLELYAEIDYALVYRPQAYEKFVAAWNYNPETGKWGQGHYFYSLRDAVTYINKKYESNRKAEISIQDILDEGYDYISANMNDIECCEDEAIYQNRLMELRGMNELLEHLEEYKQEDSGNDI